MRWLLLLALGTSWVLAEPCSAQGLDRCQGLRIAMTRLDQSWIFTQLALVTFNTCRCRPTMGLNIWVGNTDRLKEDKADDARNAGGQP